MNIENGTPSGAYGILRRFTILAVIAWSIVIAGEMIWDIERFKDRVYQLVHNEAEVHFEWMTVFREWSAYHGGAYVPTDERTPPNPYLKVPERDIETPSGRKLTLMNPAYMTRQIYSDFVDDMGVIGHITSKDYINPVNKPDPWELAALENFEKGDSERMEVSDMDGEPYMRLMKPLYVKEACLKCHADQGYEVGDVRGGISVSVPMAGYFAYERKETLNHVVMYGLIWALGLIGISLGARSVRGQIREREKVSNALRESEEHQRLILDHSAEAIYGIGLDGKCTFVNPACVKLLGYEEAGQLLGKNMHALVHHTRPDGSAYPEEECKVHVVSRGGKGVHIEDEVLWRMDGTSFPVEYWSYPLTKEGEVIGSVVNFMDITDRKRREDEVREAKELFENAFRSAPTGMALAGLGGRLFKVNQPMCELTGYSEKELLGMTTEELTHPDDRAAEKAGLERLIRGEAGSYRAEKRYIHKNGDTAWVFLSVSVVRDSAGEPLYTVKQVENITARKLAQETLRKSEERFRLLVENIDYVFWLTQVEPESVLYASPAFENVWGRPVEDLYANARIWTDAMHPADKERVGMVFESWLKGEVDGYDMEFRIVKPSGETRWIHDRGVFAKRSDGRVEWVSGVAHDITERKKADEELYRAKDMLEKTFNSLAEAVFIVDQATRTIVECNPAAERIFGYAKEEMLGRNTEFLHIDSVRYEIFGKGLFKALEAGRTFRTSFKMRRKNGEEFDSDHTVTSIYDENGDRVGVVSVVRDVSERVKAETDRQRLVMAIEQSADMVLITDSEGVIQYVNPAFEEVTGYSREEAIGQNPRILNSGKQDRLFYKGLWDTIKSGKAWSGELENKRKDGAVYQETMTISPVMDISGEITNFVAVKSDTSQKSMLSKARDYFTSVTSHELRTPLTKLGLVKVLVAGLKDYGAQPAEVDKVDAVLQESITDFDRIITAAETFTDLILAKRGRAFNRVNLGLIVQYCAEYARNEMTVEGRGVSLAVDVSGLGADAWIMGDQEMIQKAFEEVLSNAIKYTPDGGAVKVNAHREEGWAAVRISDQGPGVPERKMDLLFEPFFSLEDHDKHATSKYQFKGGGIGMGLTIARMITEYHMGRLEIGPAGEGEGAQVTMMFPLKG